MSQIESIISRLASGQTAADRNDVLALLQAQGRDLALLYTAADDVRRREVGDDVFLRGIIEFSNYCRKNCDYCGIRAGNRAVERYRMSGTEIVAQARAASGWGCTTVVLQSGEDRGYGWDELCSIVRAVKAEAGVAITLSIGEAGYDEYVRLKAAGADRFLLRFETSDRALFERIHPDDDYDHRFQCLADLRAAGFQLGSGFLIGLPGADLKAIADDIMCATALDLDMIGCGPFIPNPDTPLGNAGMLEEREVHFKVISILRLLNPRAHIPATTAFDALQRGGRDLLLRRGANVFMPNLTPAQYRGRYLLYPNKPCVDEEAQGCLRCVQKRIQRLGRRIGEGPGHTIRGQA